MNLDAGFSLTDLVGMVMKVKSENSESYAEFLAKTGLVDKPTKLSPRTMLFGTNHGIISPAKKEELSENDIFGADTSRLSPISPGELGSFMQISPDDSYNSMNISPDFTGYLAPRLNQEEMVDDYNKRVYDDLLFMENNGTDSAIREFNRRFAKIHVYGLRTHVPGFEAKEFRGETGNSDPLFVAYKIYGYHIFFDPALKDELDEIFYSQQYLPDYLSFDEYHAEYMFLARQIIEDIYRELGSNGEW
mgnify:FL=1